MTTPNALVLFFGTIFLVLLFAVLMRRRRKKARQLQCEDALKSILTATLEGRDVSAPELAGLLGLPHETTLVLIEELCARGLCCWKTAGLELTHTGREAAIPLLRKHRLTERFLVDEAGMPIERVHQVADRAEHAMSDSQLAELNEQLGHPDWDPHGDPIPDARGEVFHVDRYPLDCWPLHHRAVITHVEDEPPDALRRVLERGLQPGTELQVLSRTEDTLMIHLASQDVELPVALARQVHVRACGVEVQKTRATSTNLAELELGDRARILYLADSCRGFTRRRLLDLGITPGAVIGAKTANAGGSARVYHIRDTLIALRREQAQQVMIEKHPATSTAELPAP